MFNNLLNSTPKPQNHLLKQIREQLEKAKKNLKSESSNKKNGTENNQNQIKKKKILNKSMGNNYVYEKELNPQDSFSLIGDKVSKKNSFIRLNDTFYLNKNSIYNKENDINIANEMTNEMMKAISLLKNSLPPECNDDFFKTIMKDILALIEIMKEITIEATTFSDNMKQKCQEYENEIIFLKNQINSLTKEKEDIQEQTHLKTIEIENLKKQIQNELSSNNFQTNLELKSNLNNLNVYAPNSFGYSHSTKNSEEDNKMRKLLMDLKYENQNLLEESNILKIENKRMCDLLAQQRSQKLFKNIENKFDSIKMANNNINESSFLKDHSYDNKKYNAMSNIAENYEENKLEKTKKYRFIKPKN